MGQYDHSSLAEQLRYTAQRYLEIKAEERCCMWEAAWVIDQQDKLIDFITKPKADNE